MRIFAALIMLSALALADPVPFNDTDWFQYPDAYFPVDQVTFSDPIPGGFATATLSESVDDGFLILENNPAEGDPVLFNYTGGAATIEFDWAFENAGSDALYVDLLDPTLAFPHWVGAPFSLVATASGSGHVVWDLSLLGFTGELGINATFESTDPVGSTDLTLYEGYATISNLQFNVPATGPAPVPEPGTCALLGAAMVGYAVYRRRRRSV